MHRANLLLQLLTNITLESNKAKYSTQKKTSSILDRTHRRSTSLPQRQVDLVDRLVVASQLEMGVTSAFAPMVAL
eukprot:4889504-Amphidinium_carterae.1